MEKILSTFSNLSRNIRERFFTEDRWSDVIPDLAQQLRQAREIFYSECITALEQSKYKQAIVNRTLKPDIDINVIAFQFIYIIHYMYQYIERDDVPEFAEKLLRASSGKYHGRCTDIINCYHGLKKGKPEKLLYYFSIDVSKYICGYKVHDNPSKFPCLNSYISSGIPEKILARTNVTGCSFIIQTQIPALKRETVGIIENFFSTGDEQEREIQDIVQLDQLNHDE